MLKACNLSKQGKGALVASSLAMSPEQFKANSIMKILESFCNKANDEYGRDLFDGWHWGGEYEIAHLVYMVYNMEKLQLQLHAGSDSYPWSGKRKATDTETRYNASVSIHHKRPKILATNANMLLSVPLLSFFRDGAQYWSSLSCCSGNSGPTLSGGG